MLTSFSKTTMMSASAASVSGLDVRGGCGGGGGGGGLGGRAVSCPPSPSSSSSPSAIWPEVLPETSSKKKKKRNGGGASFKIGSFLFALGVGAGVGGAASLAEALESASPSSAFFALESASPSSAFFAPSSAATVINAGSKMMRPAGVGPGLLMGLFSSAPPPSSSSSSSSASSTAASSSPSSSSWPSPHLGDGGEGGPSFSSSSFFVDAQATGFGVWARGDAGVDVSDGRFHQHQPKPRQQRPGDERTGDGPALSEGALREPSDEDGLRPQRQQGQDQQQGRLSAFASVSSSEGPSSEGASDTTHRAGPRQPALSELNAEGLFQGVAGEAKEERQHVQDQALVKQHPSAGPAESASPELSDERGLRQQIQDQDQEHQAKQQGRPSAPASFSSSHGPSSEGASSAATSIFHQGPDADASSTTEVSHPESSESAADGLQAAAGEAEEQRHAQDQAQTKQQQRRNQERLSAGPALPESSSGELSDEDGLRQQLQGHQAKQRGRPSAHASFSASQGPSSHDASFATTSIIHQGPDADASSSTELIYPASSESTAGGHQAAAARALADGRTAEEEGSGHPRRRLSLEGACLDSFSLKAAVDDWTSSDSSVRASAETTYGPIAQWNTSCSTDMSYLFQFNFDNFDSKADFDDDISGWDTSRVTTMEFMFDGASSFDQPIGNWATGKVTSMEYMFAFASSFNQPIDNWATGNVTIMEDMFNGASSFNQDLGEWDVGSVTTMDYMFMYANAFNQPIGNWDTGKVTFMRNMFNGASFFNQDIGMWDVGSVTTMRQMFLGADAFNMSQVCQWADNITLPDDLTGKDNAPVGQICSCDEANYNPTQKICCTDSTASFLVEEPSFCPAPELEPSPAEAAMPSETFANMTSLDVDPVNNVALLEYAFTPGWDHEFKFYPAVNATGRPCLRAYPDDAPQVASEFLTHESSGDAASVLGGLRERVARLVTVVAQNLTRSNIWFPTVVDDDSEGTVEFCAVARLVATLEGGASVVVGYVVDKIELAVNLANSTFTLSAGAVAQAVSNSTAELKNIYSVYAYLCPGTLSNAPGKYDNTSAPQVIKANSKASVCLAPDSKSVQITSLRITEATNGAGESLIDYLRVNAPFSPAFPELLDIVKKDVNGDGDAYTSDGRKVVEISVYALALMFAGENPSLKLGGTAGLSFFDNPNGGDRRLGEGEAEEVSFKLRGLQGAGNAGGDAGTAGLSLEIALAHKETDLVDENVEHHELFHKEGHAKEDDAAETSSAAGAIKRKTFLGLVAAVLIGAGAATFF